jgi:hypothetical protein
MVARCGVNARTTGARAQLNTTRSDVESATMIIEVVAGIIPGKDPEPEFTKRWAITGKEWREAADRPGGQGNLLAERNGQAQGYAAMLMLQPDRLNWVRVDWIWL